MCGLVMHLNQVLILLTRPFVKSIRQRKIGARSVAALAEQNSVRYSISHLSGVEKSSETYRYIRLPIEHVEIRP